MTPNDLYAIVIIACGCVTIASSLATLYYNHKADAAYRRMERARRRD